MSYYRLIFRIRYQVGPLSYTHIVLDRSGQSATGNSNGRPRPPVKRTVDLRPGDQIMAGGVWKTIIEAVVEAQWWMTEEAAKKLAVTDGYLYRPKRQPIAMPKAEMHGGMTQFRVTYADGEAVV